MPSPPTTARGLDVLFLDEEIKALQEKHAAAEYAKERLRDGLDAKTEEVARYSAQISVLISLREKLVADGWGQVLRRSGKKPSEAIIEAVVASPGITQREILDRLEGEIATTASNVRHLLRTTIANMTKSGRLTKTEDGRYSLAEP